MNKIKQSAFVAGIGLLLLAAACGGNGKPGKGTGKDTVTGGCNIDTPAVFSSFIPHEVNVTLSEGYNGIVATDQPCFDIFSWESFIALNWPADATGKPVQGNFSDQPALSRVWEYYQDPSQVFQTLEYQLPFSDPKKTGGITKGFYQFSKASDELTGLPPAIAEATGQPLIDKDLNFALYEIRMNPDEVHYIHSNGLDTKEGQQGKTISFPPGTSDSTGTIEIKATWKIMTETDDTSKFYCRRAAIYVPASESATGQALHLTETVGLVAMHILHKTTNFPFWIWTTFEHVSNAPEQANVGKPGNYSFYNPACSGCTANTPPPAGPYLWAAEKPYAKAYATNQLYGTQAVRADTVYGPTDKVNSTWQAALRSAGSVFANYRLIGSQWSRASDTFPSDTIAAPVNLSNTTLETYIQGSSCTMTCHKSATDAAGQKSDFSFLLAHAKSTSVLDIIRKKNAKK
jgi:hypothetical protein